MTKPPLVFDTFHRIEVITGNGRRRRWTDALKEAIVAEALEEGAVITEVARRHHVAASQVFRWRAQARQRALTLPVGTETFAPMAEHRQPQGLSSAYSLPSQMIDVEIAGARLRIPPNASREAIYAVIEAIGRLSRRPR